MFFYYHLQLPTDILIPSTPTVLHVYRSVVCVSARALKLSKGSIFECGTIVSALSSDFVYWRRLHRSTQYCSFPLSYGIVLARSLSVVMFVTPPSCIDGTPLKNLLFKVLFTTWRGLITRGARGRPRV